MGAEVAVPHTAAAVPLEAAIPEVAVTLAVIDKEVKTNKEATLAGGLFYFCGYELKS
jgi:hypothetical protein